MRRQIDKLTGERGLYDLYEELRRRFGTKKALEIVEAIEHANTCSDAPAYMVVKACSEMLELFRGDAKAAAKDLRAFRTGADSLPTDVHSLEEKRREHEVQRVFRHYWVSMKLFYGFYNEALEAARMPQYLPSTFTDPTPFARAA